MAGYWNQSGFNTTGSSVCHRDQRSCVTCLLPVYGSRKRSDSWNALWSDSEPFPWVSHMSSSVALKNILQWFFRTVNHRKSVSSNSPPENWICCGYMKPCCQCLIGIYLPHSSEINWKWQLILRFMCALWEPYGVHHKHKGSQGNIM